MSDMVYRYKSGSRLKGNAQEVGEAIEAIADDQGVADPSSVVDAARDSGSVLHTQFEWNNRKAGDKYREDQAGHLLRCILIERPDNEDENDPATTRAYRVVNVASENSSDSEDTIRGYVTTHRAMNEPLLRAQVLEDAKRELKAFRNKYAELKELVHIFEAIDAI